MVQFSTFLVTGLLGNSVSALTIPRISTSFTRKLLPRQVEITNLSTAIPIPRAILDLVRARANEDSKASWELGTMAQAFLEIDWPHISVYGTESIPPPLSATGTDNISSVLAVADYALAITPPTSLSLFMDLPDTAVGDPPAIGIATLLANWTKGSRPDAAFNDYDTPLRKQLGYIVDQAPKNWDGAISHRPEQVQLWSDFVFMVPPFMAYYAALYQPSVNTWLLLESYNQIKLYRNNLYDPNRGLWKHIAIGWNTDDGIWATGNGWAAAGMLRVLVTINQTSVGNNPEFQVAQRDLQNWATEIVNNVWQYQQSNGTLLNYPDNPYSFADSAGTALLAAATYRIACLSTYLRGSTSTSNSGVILPDVVALSPASLRAAHAARVLIINSLDTTTGWLQNVVNPWSYSQRGQTSAEGQSFVLMMESAWRVWAKNQGPK